MRKFLSWLWSLFKNNILLIIGFVFVVIIPAILLIEIASNSPAVLGVRISFIICIILAVVLIVVTSKICRIARKQKPIAEAVIIAILFVIWWSVFLGIFIGLINFAERLNNFWWQVGICWLIGNTAYIAHAVKKQRRGNGKN